MIRLSSFWKTALALGVPALLMGITILLITTIHQSQSKALAIGVTIDLLITIPVVYFFLVRKTRIPTITVIPILILGVTIGTLILPEEHQGYLTIFKTWGLPFIELCVISFIIYKVHKTIKRFRSLDKTTTDFYSTLITTCRELFPKRLVYPLVTEIAVFYFGFFKWRSQKLQKNEFTYHKESGSIALLSVILFMVAVETFVLHLLLNQWSTIAAWILSFLSIYSGLQVFGLMKSLFFRPIKIVNNQLHLRYGIMSETTIPLNQIKHIELSSSDLDENVEILSLLGKLESHNVVLHLKSKHKITRLYGMKKMYKKLALHVDEKEKFYSTLRSFIENQ